MYHFQQLIPVTDRTYVDGKVIGKGRVVPLGGSFDAVCDTSGV